MKVRWPTPFNPNKIGFCIVTFQMGGDVWDRQKLNHERKITTKLQQNKYEGTPILKLAMVKR